MAGAVVGARRAASPWFFERVLENGACRGRFLVDAHQVENWWPATSTTLERTETAEALTLFADWNPGAYNRLD